MTQTETRGGPSAVFTRRFDLDWLRIIAFGLLIFYHIGMFYVTWGWHVKSPHANSEPELAMMLLNPWRLALLFFISGVALRFLSDKLGSGRFALDRTVRLLPVIVFGMVYVYLPFMLFPMVLGLSMVPREVVEAAGDLGASRLQTFREVELPLAMPGFIIGGLLTFVLAVGAVAESKVLGGQSVIVITHDIEIAFTYAQNWPLGAALSVLLMAVVGTLVLLVLRYLDLDRILGRR